MFYPLISEQNTRLYLGGGETGGSFHKFMVPSDAKMLYFILVGGGGNGGAGFTRASGVSGGGGGGGGCGSTTIVHLPVSKYIPSILYLKTAASGGGSSDTRLCIDQSLDYPNLIAYANNGGNGAIGTTSAGGAGGTAGVIMSRYLVNYAHLGMVNPIVGRNGSAGSNGASTATSFSWGSDGTLLCGGSGGGGVSAAGTLYGGANITGAAYTPTIAGAPVGFSRGNDGYNGILNKYFSGTGGTGGGGSNSSNGGDGGDGSPGCGGGGGGAGVAAGVGGLGGPGFIIASWW